MSSDWQKLADLWYRKREVYTAQWADESKKQMLHQCVVAGAPYGGPVATLRDEHVFQKVQGSLVPHLQTWTAAGRPIAKTSWSHNGLLTMGWSSQETLVCVFDTGIVRTFTVLCKPLHTFTIDSRIKAEGCAVLATLWPNGIALMTKRFSLFVNPSVVRSGDMCHRCADIPRLQMTPHCLCVLPPPHEDSPDVQVIVGTAEGPVFLADRHEARELPGLDGGPYVAFAVSNSGRFLACLSQSGLFKVLAVDNDLQELDVANIECRKKPKQMVWCGDDCIALYLALPTPSEGMQHVIFVGGPQNDWIPFQYDAPLHLVSECDGCRIMGTYKIEFVQRVPPSTEAIYSIGNYDPPAMLHYALERFEKGDVCVQESLRLIDNDLADAVGTCIEAASFEHDPDTVEKLLNSAVFGRHFLPEPLDPKPFVETCRNLRICIELRKAPLDIPLTTPQLERLGIAGLTMRLAQRHHHLLALRISEWVGHSRDRVLFHWACEKIKGAKGSAMTDEQLRDSILEKFRGCPGIGYAEIARVASEMCRPYLATRLLDHEPRGHAQVQVLLQLSRESEEEDNRTMMLKFAAEKAAQSGDPDLIHCVISTACRGGDPTVRDVDIKPLIQLISEKPQVMQVVGDLFAASLQNSAQFEQLRTFHERLGHSRQAAYCAVQQGFRRREPEERIKWLNFARDFFGQTESGLQEAERSGIQFCAHMSGENAELLKAQMNLEEQSRSRNWSGGPHKFLGLSLVDTLRLIIGVGETADADNLKTVMKLSEKRYWRIKVRALADGGHLEELSAMASIRSSPIGYELVIDQFLKHNRRDLALPLIPKVRSPEQQAVYYSKLGREEDAAAARAQRQDGPGRLLQNILRWN